MYAGGSVRLVDGAFDALITVDAQQRVVDLNAAAEQMFGYARAEALGKDLNELIVPPEERDAQRAALNCVIGGDQRMLRPGKTARFEAMRADGSRFPFDLMLSVTSEDPLQITGWIHDCTDENRHKRQAVLSGRVESAVGTGSWEWDTAANVVLWSDGLFRTFGYEPGEVTPSVDLVLEHVHPDDRERVRGIIEGMGRTGSAEPYEMRILKHGGEVAFLNVTLAATEDRDRGRLLYGSVLDMTAQRDAEQRANFLTAVVEWTSKASDLPLKDAIALLLHLALPVSLGAAASFWVPKDGLLRCVATHSMDSLDSGGLDQACGEVELPPGAGLPGRAWAEGEVAVLRAGDANDHVRQKAMDATGLAGGVAFSATGPSGTIAVVEILFREVTEVSDPGFVTLRACGVLIGEFLSHRRGELESTSLTKREIEILQLASEGLTGPKIAAHLVISPATVKSHFEHIYPKLGVSDRSNAVAQALRLGLIR